MNVSYDIIGQNVRRAREAAGLSLEKAAELAEFSAAYLMHIEKGERPLSLESLAKLSEVLDIPMEQLLERAIVRAR